MNTTNNIIEKSTVNPSLFNSEKGSQWFDDIIATIKTHRLVLETGLADDSRKDFYKLLITGSEVEIFGVSNGLATMGLVKSMLFDYIQELNRKEIEFEDIAFDNTNSGLLVWAIINDDDDIAEDHLLLSAAKVNAKFNQYGFAIKSTILEKSDEYPIPNHYQSVVNF